ncbi:hypothetical protein [Butyrivibrio hungatei]|uniref:Uncharacterized protein n=1 Tax=Butyrivibrio hungatei TaxID=185008 RepID=A0A1D9P5W9_9FIRM|nr:hypothetical protein [Butyrivibrio hungatei]AOZ97903.1 hypothetical protein bhn_II104 [Butyrivibrio hungatei]
MDKYYKLAQVIKAAGKELVKDNDVKVFNVDEALGHKRTDKSPDVIEVKNDGGYRSILIGHIQGNVSYDTGGLLNVNNKGYAYIYSENVLYTEDLGEVWCYKCYPTTAEIRKRLRILARTKRNLYGGHTVEIYPGEYEASKEDNYYMTKAYLSWLVEKYADMVWEDSRSAEEIVFNAIGERSKNN